MVWVPTLVSQSWRRVESKSYVQCDVGHECSRREGSQQQKSQEYAIARSSYDIAEL